ncbi:hypothetical protein ABMA27_007256 [Loxostege sticticalis]|uniref:Uncharacterized protein n=1 Tax=Loxostege sticticalis TaxID=481309 RepID=A0ABR3HES7_LOXSC
MSRTYGEGVQRLHIARDKCGVHNLSVGQRTRLMSGENDLDADLHTLTFAWLYLPTPARPTRKSHSARKGGGRSFQHRDAANLKEPRNATARCFGVTNKLVHILLGRLAAHSNFSYRYLGLAILMTPNNRVARCNCLRASIFNMFAALRNGRAHAFCTLCTSREVLFRIQGPYTMSQ